MGHARLALWTALLLGAAKPVEAGPFAPAASVAGSTAVPANDGRIQGWATVYLNFSPGPQQIGDPDLGQTPASFGGPANALGPADATPGAATPVVSLGDGGSITLTFGHSIANGGGFDFAVYENAFNNTFLELAFVAVSTDGTHFVTFPSTSLTPTSSQVNGDDGAGPFGAVDPTNINNLAGKYRAGFGTPFDLADLTNQPNAQFLDFNHVNYVRVTDVIGDINAPYATMDSFGHVINDPWPTPYPSSGFDLDAVAVLNLVPEPGVPLLLLIGAATGLAWRRR